MCVGCYQCRAGVFGSVHAHAFLGGQHFPALFWEGGREVNPPLRLFVSSKDSLQLVSGCSLPVASPGRHCWDTLRRPRHQRLGAVRQPRRGLRDRWSGFGAQWRGFCGFRATGSDSCWHRFLNEGGDHSSDQDIEWVGYWYFEWCQLIFILSFYFALQHWTRHFSWE